MEEEISKEKNREKRMNLIKELRVREYIKQDAKFKNLFDLPIPVSIDYIVERYALADRNSQSNEISLEILQGIHKNIVQTISNDLNGIVLNDDGTINEKASAIQMKEIEDEEKRKAFHIDSKSNAEKIIDEIFNFGKDREKFEVERIFENENGRSWLKELKDWEKREKTKASDEEKNSFNNENETKYDSKKNTEEIMARFDVKPGTLEEKLLKEAIKINEIVIRETKYGSMNEKTFKALAPEIQYVIKRSLIIEIIGNANKENILETARTLMPEFKNVGPFDMITYMVENTLSADDHIGEIMGNAGSTNKKGNNGIKELDEIDLIDSTTIEEALENAKDLSEDESYRNKVGTINYKKFKELNEGRHVEAGMTLFKKNVLEKMLFSHTEDFDRTVSVKLIPIYKEYLIKEAAQIDEKRKEDPELWKTIQPKPDTVLSILDSIIKENSSLLQEYMDGELNIDFNKIKESEPDKHSHRFIDIVNRSMDNLTKLRKDYPEKKDMLFEKMKNFKKSENPEQALKEIEEGIRSIPRELVYLDFFGDTTYQKFVRENLPGFTKELKDHHADQMRKVQKNKDTIARLQIEKIKSYGNSKEVDDNEEITDEHLQKIKAKLKERKEEIIRANVNSKYKGKKFKFSRKEKKVEDAVFKSGKDIKGATSLAQYMAKPKMIVDEIEIPVTENTNSEKASHTFETLLKEQGLVAKFKSVEEDLTVDEYASKMGEILTSINDKLKDGTLPSEINVNGKVQPTTLKDIVSMSFDNTEILLENLPEDISKMSKEDIEQAIKSHIEKKAKEDEQKQEEQAKEQVEAKQEIEEKEKVEPQQEVETKEQVEPQQEVETKEQVEPQQEVETKEQVESQQEIEQEKQAEQEELAKRLAEEQKQKVAQKEQAKEVVESVKEAAEPEKETEPTAKEEVKVEENQAKQEQTTQLVKDTFFNRVKRGFLENKVVKKITELFSKKEEKTEEVNSAAVNQNAENSKQTTTEEKDFWGEIENKDEVLKMAHQDFEKNKQGGAEKVSVGVIKESEQEK